jgi:hypothetical protein
MNADALAVAEDIEPEDLRECLPQSPEDERAYLFEAYCALGPEGLVLRLVEERVFLRMDGVELDETLSSNGDRLRSFIKEEDRAALRGIAAQYLESGFEDGVEINLLETMNAILQEFATVVRGRQRQDFAGDLLASVIENIIPLGEGHISQICFRDMEDTGDLTLEALGHRRARRHGSEAKALTLALALERTDDIFFDLELSRRLAQAYCTMRDFERALVILERTSKIIEAGRVEEYWNDELMFLNQSVRTALISFKVRSMAAEERSQTELAEVDASKDAFLKAQVEVVDSLDVDIRLIIYDRLAGIFRRCDEPEERSYWLKKLLDLEISLDRETNKLSLALTRVVRMEQDATKGEDSETLRRISDDIDGYGLNVAMAVCEVAERVQQSEMVRKCAQRIIGDSKAPRRIVLKAYDKLIGVCLVGDDPEEALVCMRKLWVLKVSTQRGAKSLDPLLKKVISIARRMEGEGPSEALQAMFDAIEEHDPDMIMTLCELAVQGQGYHVAVTVAKRMIKDSDSPSPSLYKYFDIMISSLMRSSREQEALVELKKFLALEISMGRNDRDLTTTLSRIVSLEKRLTDVDTGAILENIAGSDGYEPNMLLVACRVARGESRSDLEIALARKVIEAEEVPIRMMYRAYDTLIGALVESGELAAAVSVANQLKRYLNANKRSDEVTPEMQDRTRDGLARLLYEARQQKATAKKA